MMYRVAIIPVFYLLNASYVIYADEVNTNEANDGYVLDDSLFKNQSGETIKLLKNLSEDHYNPGVYNVDVYVNKQYIGRKEIDFVAGKKGDVQPCFNYDVIKNLGLTKEILAGIPESADECIYLTDYVKSTAKFNLSKLHLNLMIAQNDLINVPRGYTNPESWQAGTSIGFVNYMASAYHSSVDSGFTTQKQSSGFLYLNGGINFGKWQFRQQSNANFSEGGNTRWNNTRSYITRPVEQIKGNVLFGQTYTSGRFFSGLRFTGVNVSSDERMLPQSMRGYAPTITGIATSNAKVSVFQNNRIIYETSVSAGAFTINDLYPTSYNGNLLVKVEEADGSSSEFSVPFSAVPESVRKGRIKYNFDAGKTKDISQNSYFADTSIQYGLSNKVSLISGLRVSDDYYAGIVGGTYSDYFGTVGTTLNYSYADKVDGKTLTGWMANINYSKTFTPTQTTLTLAGYRYSTDDYRELSDVLERRYAAKHNSTGQYSENYKQSSQFSLTMNQTMGEWGSLFLSGSISQYHDSDYKNKQIQLGYSKAFNNGVMFNASVLRQYYDADKNNTSNFNYFSTDNKSETSVNLSLSLPLNFGRSSGNNSATFSYANSAQHTNSYQATLTGYQGQINPLNYSAGLSYDDQSDKTIFNAGLGKRFTYANTGLNASVSSKYWQVAGNVQGALAVHSGGVTFGQYLSDTFALVEAQGAQGAEVNNSQGTKIDWNGYALVPSLTPYQENTVSINPVGTSYFLDIEAANDKITPYAGAAVKVKFKTKMGYPLLIQTKLSSGDFIPIGASILNENNEVLGVSGQNGQIYVRTEQEQGKLTVAWGSLDQEKCNVDYAIPKSSEEQPIIRLTGTCIAGQ